MSLENGFCRLGGGKGGAARHLVKPATDVTTPDTGAIVFFVPISMVPLNLLRVRRFARPVTFVAETVTMTKMIPRNPTDLGDIYHFVLQLYAVMGIVAIAWRWALLPDVSRTSKATGF